MSMGNMSWEPTQFTPARKRWWNEVLDTDWVNDQEIVEQVGPEYLMFEDMVQFGSEAVYHGFPKRRR